MNLLKSRRKHCCILASKVNSSSKETALLLIIEIKTTENFLLNLLSFIWVYLSLPNTVSRSCIFIMLWWWKESMDKLRNKLIYIWDIFTGPATRLVVSMSHDVHVCVFVRVSVCLFVSMILKAGLLEEVQMAHFSWTTSQKFIPKADLKLKGLYFHSKI